MNNPSAGEEVIEAWVQWNQLHRLVVVADGSLRVDVRLTGMPGWMVCPNRHAPPKGVLISEPRDG